MAQVRKTDIRIMKSIWRKNEAGIWCVHDTSGIDLKPQDGYAPDYFKIKSEINLLTQRPGHVMQDFFTTFGTTEFLIRQSIVPVVAWNEGDGEVRCIGTGFFISASGLLMTAAHVLRDPVDEKYTTVTQIAESSFKLGEGLHFGVILPANPAMRNAPFAVPQEFREAKWFVAPFEWTQHWGNSVNSPLLHQPANFKLGLDIAVCKVREGVLGGAYQPLNIGPHSLHVGDRAIAIGYAEMKNIPFKSNDSYQPELVVSVGAVTNIYPDNITEKQTSTDGPCFDFDAKIPGKMSGAPILVGSGIVTKGVVSRSWQDEKHASGCLIAPMLGLELPIKKSLLELMQLGSEGMAIIHGRGI